MFQVCPIYDQLVVEMGFDPEDLKTAHNERMRRLLKKSPSKILAKEKSE